MASSVFQPTIITRDEYNGLLDQIRNEMTETECREELLDSARYNDVDVLRGILQIYPTLCNAVDGNGNTSLHKAAVNGHAEIVQILLQLGADPSTKNSSGNTALHWAASNGQKDIVDILLKHKQVDVLERNAFGRSALTEGFESRNTDLVQSLLEHDSATEEKLMQSKGSEEEVSDNDGATHQFNFGGTPLSVRELPIAKNDQDAILGQVNPADDTTGLGIWSASLVAAQWMVSMKERFAGKAVLELGAGCAVPTLTIAKAVPTARLYATDFNSYTVENARYNIGMNECTQQVKPIEMNWQDPCSWPKENIDIIIGSDLIYQSDMVPLLIQTVKGLLQRNGCFLYVTPLTERMGKDEFFKLMAADFQIQEHELSPDFISNPFASQDDDILFLHFHELQSTKYKLYEFTPTYT